MRRQVSPELLDELPADDPRAIGSRRDLQRINRIMGNAAIVARSIKVEAARPRLSIVELGGGDGTFLLDVARRLGRLSGHARAVIVDQRRLLTPATCDGFRSLAWTVESVQADVFAWIGENTRPADVVIANLFLHHFRDDRLSALLRDASRRTALFVTCEPQRSRTAFAAASMMGAIGCNAVSVHDGKISVRAGFRDMELSVRWPQDGSWQLTEGRTGLFSHAFVARRRLAAPTV